MEIWTPDPEQFFVENLNNPEIYLNSRSSDSNSKRFSWSIDFFSLTIVENNYKIKIQFEFGYYLATSIMLLCIILPYFLIKDFFFMAFHSKVQKYAGIIRTRVLFHGGPYMRNYGMYSFSLWFVWDKPNMILHFCLWWKIACTAPTNANKHYVNCKQLFPVKE